MKSFEIHGRMGYDSDWYVLIQNVKAEDLGRLTDHYCKKWRYVKTVENKVEGKGVYTIIERKTEAAGKESKTTYTVLCDGKPIDIWLVVFNKDDFGVHYGDYEKNPYTSTCLAKEAIRKHKEVTQEPLITQKLYTEDFKEITMQKGELVNSWDLPVWTVCCWFVILLTVVVFLFT